ncbi:MAG: AraC family transcriptional regulator [Clostridia bacterium]|nr:AraC family transcriptional regulator [Clostridia bacterium]
MKEQILAVQRMQDYISENLGEAISMEELAAVSMFSPWHSYRIFRQYTGLTPADYIRRLRLSRSALRIRDEGCSITEAAFDACFGSPEGYQRAFFKEFGCNPGEYAQNPIPIGLFIPYGAKYRELISETFNEEENMKVTISRVTKPARSVIIKRGIAAKDYFEYCNEVGCDIWGLLTSMKSISHEPVCLWLPEEYRKPGTSEYVQGVEVLSGYDGPIPDGFDIIDLPEAEYLMFCGEPFEEENFCQAINTVQKQLEEYDPSELGLKWDESNPKIQLEPIASRGYIEMKAVKAR